jgi:hypothetical protein
MKVSAAPGLPAPKQILKVVAVAAGPGFRVRIGLSETWKRLVDRRKLFARTAHSFHHWFHSLESTRTFCARGDVASYVGRISSRCLRIGCSMGLVRPGLNSSCKGLLSP